MSSTQIRRVALALAGTALLGSLGLGAAPAQAAAARPAAAAQPAQPAQPATDPAPSCHDNGDTVPCWEYRTWYWTYDNCESAGAGLLNSQYDNYVCTLTSNGVGVGLWLHKVRT